jgi:hypothetical protein
MVAGILAKRLRTNVADVPPGRRRPPVRPLPLSALAADAED